MLRTDDPRQRRASLSRGRGPQQTVQRQKDRTRRFVVARTAEWHERQCAQDRAQKALRKLGVLIRLRLVLRDGVSKASARHAAAMLRRDGFIVWCDEGALILTGEPILALTLVDVVAQAGILCPDLRARLDDILQTISRRGAKENTDTGHGIREILPFLSSVEPPT
jgi:hypothetical protein